MAASTSGAAAVRSRAVASVGARCARLEPSHGRWYFAVQLPGVDGKRTRVRRGGYASRAEAERACMELLRLPGPRAAARMWTVRRWLEFWLSEIEDRLCPSTVRSYRTIVYQHLIPHLGRGAVVDVADPCGCSGRWMRCPAGWVRGGRLTRPGGGEPDRAVLAQRVGRGATAGDDRTQPGMAAAVAERRPPARGRVG